MCQADICLAYAPLFFTPILSPWYVFTWYGVAYSNTVKPEDFLVVNRITMK